MNEYIQNYYWKVKALYYYKLVHLLIFYFEIIIREKIFHGICIEKRKLYSLYVKVVYKISDKFSSRS